jgi:CubicO group peptidase (beta-lactamase class C family)
MQATVAFEDGVSSVANRAYGYSRNAGAWTRTDQSSTSAVLGDGGIYSSIEDLAKWDAALYDDRLLSAQSRQLAFTPATHTERYPQRKLTVVVLSNRNEPEPYATALAIAELYKPETRRP